MIRLSARRSNDEKRFAALSTFFEASNPLLAEQNGGKYNRLELVDAFDIIDEEALRRFLRKSHAENSRQMQQCRGNEDPSNPGATDVTTNVKARTNSLLEDWKRDQPLLTRENLVDPQSMTDSAIQLNANERYLFHGSRRCENYPLLLYNPFDTNASSGGLFGKGSYYADDPTKSDMYVDSVGYDATAIKDFLSQLHIDDKRLESALKGAISENGDKMVHFMFGCRVALGCSVVRSQVAFRNGKFKLNARKPNEPLMFNKPTTDPWGWNDVNHALGSVVTYKELNQTGGLYNPRTNYNEYVIYDGARSLPETLFVYVRRKVTSPGNPDKYPAAPYSP